MGSNISETNTLELALSPNIKLKELVLSAGHPELNAVNTAYALTHLNVLKVLASHIQIIRDHFGIPVIIDSGIRCPELNAAVGGVNTATSISQHVKGEAADLYFPPDKFDLVFKWIWKESKLNFGQLIDEINSRGHRWIHYSLASLS